MSCLKCHLISWNNFDESVLILVPFIVLTVDVLNHQPKPCLFADAPGEPFTSCQTSFLTAASTLQRSEAGWSVRSQRRPARGSGAGDCCYRRWWIEYIATDEWRLLLSHRVTVVTHYVWTASWLLTNEPIALNIISLHSHSTKYNRPWWEIVN